MRFAFNYCFHFRLFVTANVQACVLQLLLFLQFLCGDGVRSPALSVVSLNVKKLTIQSLIIHCFIHRQENRFFACK